MCDIGGLLCIYCSLLSRRSSSGGVSRCRIGCGLCICRSCRRSIGCALWTLPWTNVRTNAHCNAESGFSGRGVKASDLGHAAIIVNAKTFNYIGMHVLHFEIIDAPTLFPLRRKSGSAGKVEVQPFAIFEVILGLIRESVQRAWTGHEVHRVSLRRDQNGLARQMARCFRRCFGVNIRKTFQALQEIREIWLALRLTQDPILLRCAIERRAVCGPGRGFQHATIRG